MYCIDASVLLSAARGTEKYSEQSKNFLDTIRQKQQKIFLPEIVLPEIASGLIRATKDESFTQSLVDSLKDIPNFSFVPVDGKLSDIAVEVIIKTHLRGADAIYVALALD